MFYERLADAADVRDFGILSDPDAVINNSADVLGKMAVLVRRNGADRLVDEYLHPRLGALSSGAAGTKKRRGASGERTAHESSPADCLHF